jgi:hypothetical protein
VKLFTPSLEEVVHFGASKHVSQENLHIGEMVDISDSYALFNVGKSNEYHLLSPLNGFWGGNDTTPLPRSYKWIKSGPEHQRAILFCG